MYRLAAFDLDGTLLNSENAISEGNAEALRWLMARGVHVAAATARSYESAMRQFEPHGIQPSAVCCGGADVRHADGTTIARTPLPADFARFIAELSDRAGWTATLSTSDFTFRRESPTPSWAVVPRPGLKVVESLAGVDLEGMLTALIQPELEDENLEQLYAWQGRVALHRALSFNGGEIVTATAPDAHKGHGLRQLCDALGVALHEAVVFGDSDVDLPMFEVAGHAVAVANATANVLARAGSTTLSADEDGVAAAIRRLWA